MKNTKIILVMIFFGMILFINSTTVNAETFPAPTYSNWSISSHEINNGESFNISVEVNSKNVNLDSIHLYFVSPITKTEKKLELKQVDDSNIYANSFSISNEYEPGTWKIVNVKGYNQYLLSSTELSYNNNSSYCSFANCTDLSQLYFTVKGTEYDATTIIYQELSISDNNLTNGDKLTFEIPVYIGTNDIENVYLYYIMPITGKEKSFKLTYDSSKQKYVGTFTIKDGYESGDWQLKYIVAADSEILGFRTYVDNINATSCASNSTVVCANLSAANLTITGTTADIQAPTINPASLTVSNKKAVIGDEIIYSIKISDDRSIEKAWIKIVNETGEEKYITLKQNGSNYTGTFKIGSNTAKGKWKIEIVSASDYSGNAQYYYNGTKQDTNLSKYYDWSNIDIYNYQYFTTPNYVTNSLSNSTNVIDKVGESIVKLKAQDEFGIKSVRIIYQNPVNLKEYILETSLSNEFYEGKMSFNQYGFNGIWKIKRIEIISEKEQTRVVCNSELNPSSGCIDLSVGDIMVKNLIQDEEKPILKTYSLNNSFIKFNDSLVISVNGIDEKSGIRKISLNYTLPDGTKQDYIMEKNDKTGLFEYSFAFDNYLKVGKYKINSIYLEDNAGNSNGITSNLSDLDFEFRSIIEIQSPSKFLDYSSVYVLKAFLYSNDYSAKDIRWKSSDSSIVTINSLTGEITTYNKTGLVTITAYLCDNPNIKKEIELRVTESTVKVGEEVSLGNSNYISYSKVTWTIEDTSILGYTGKTGIISINNNYKHSITVKGLKAGETRLTMKMSSTLSSSYPVYVYDVVSKLVSNHQFLKMKTNETINLRITDGNKNVNELIFISENDNIVSVDSTGKVTAKALGSTNIKVFSTYSDAIINIPVDVVIPLESIELNHITGSLNINETETLTVTYNPVNTTENKTVEWISSNKEIATVTNGVVKAIKPGNVTITAKVGEKTATYNLIIYSPLQSISLNKNSGIIPIRETETLTVTYNPMNTTDNKTVEWISSNKEIATVTNGVVKAIKPGNVTITAKVGEKTATYNLEVKEYPLQSISLNKVAGTLNINETETLTVTYNPMNTTDNKTVEWISSNKEIATVTNGVVKAIKPGNVTITAKVGEKTAKYKLTVMEKINLTDVVIKTGYKISDGLVHGFKIGETIENLRQKFGNQLTLNTSNKKIGTGVQVNYNNETATVVVFGDLTGEGDINSADLLKMRQYLLGTTKLDGAYKKAASIANGTTINSADLLRLRQHLLGTKMINQ